ncbi:MULTISPECIES: hypothetical protein [unclassified Microcoleus]|uniref:hypothetical protein n=1 Tax=unclassified Microcoleus TaxID=2642155 RepID=UPI002FCF914D
MKISLDRPNKALRPQTAGCVLPLRCIFPAGGTPHKHPLQIVQRRSHSSAFGQSHAAEKPDRP